MAEFEHTKFAMFRSIRAQIFCPSSGDLAQITGARTSLMNFILVLKGRHEVIGNCEPYSMEDIQQEPRQKVLIEEDETEESSNKIPPLQAVFIDSETSTWIDHTLLDSYARMTFVDVPWIKSDLELLLAPFGYLRKVQYMHILLPTDLKTDKILL